MTPNIVCHFQSRRLPWYQYVLYLQYLALVRCTEHNTAVLKSPINVRVWNVTAHAQKTRFRLSAKRTSPNRWRRQFSRLLAAEVCASAVVMLDTPCSEVVWRVASHSIRQFPLHFLSSASPCAITFQLESTTFKSLAPKQWLQGVPHCGPQQPGTSVQLNRYACSHAKKTILAIWRPGERASWQILIIKPTSCTNFPNFFLE